MNYYEKKICDGMKMHKKLSCDLEVKSLSDDGVFAGYGSVFDVVDNQKDIVLRGAFAGSLSKREKSDIKLLWQHDVSEPIGVIEDIKEDENGLYVRGRLLLNIKRAKEAYELLKSGVVKGLSIGYSPTRYRTDPDTGVRLLEAVDLWEVSLVTFPANEAAQVTVVKSSDKVAIGEAKNEQVPAWQAVKLLDNLDLAIDRLK